jgi:hypothetical protein
MLKLSQLDYIIRLDAVDERYPGGRDALINDNRDRVGRSVFFDEDLIILSSVVGIQGFRLLDNHYEEKGLQLTEMVRGIRIAGDRVYFSAQSGWSEPCDWLGVNEWDLTCWYWKENYWENNRLHDFYHPLVPSRTSGGN